MPIFADRRDADLIASIDTYRAFTWYRCFLQAQGAYCPATITDCPAELLGVLTAVASTRIRRVGPPPRTPDVLDSLRWFQALRRVRGTGPVPASIEELPHSLQWLLRTTAELYAVEVNRAARRRKASASPPVAVSRGSLRERMAERRAG